MKKTGRKRIILIKATASATFFFILLSFVQREDLVTVFSSINWIFFFLSFLMAIVMLMVSCLKWKLLLDASGQRLSYFRLLRIYLTGYFFSNLLPSQVGGDLVRSYYAGKLVKNQATAAASVFLERFTGMLFLLILVILAPLMLPQLYRNPFVYFPAIGATCLLFLTLWILRVKEPLTVPDAIIKRVLATLYQLALRTNITYFRKSVRWAEKTYNRTLKHAYSFKTELQVSLATIRSEKQLFFYLFILTASFYFLTWVNVYISFLAFGASPDFFAISALVPTIMFVGQLPITLLGNLGFIESVFVFYFLQLQIPAAESLAVGLLLRVKMLFLGVMGYFYYLSLSHETHTSPLPGNESNE